MSEISGFFEGQNIYSLRFPNDDEITLGDWVGAITVVMVPGNGALVPWFRVAPGEFGNHDRMINSVFVVEVELLDVIVKKSRREIDDYLEELNKGGQQ